MIESSRIFYRYHRLGGYELAREFVVQTALRPASRLCIPCVTLEIDGVLTLSPGYRWDGATGACDTKNFMRGSAAHDAIYDMHQQELAVPEDWKKHADSLLNRLCREDGMWPWRRWRVRQAVRKLGCARPRDINRYLEERVAP